MIEQTLVLIKPDGVKRGLMGEIITRFEKVGLKMIHIDKDFANNIILILKKEEEKIFLLEMLNFYLLAL